MPDPLDRLTIAKQKIDEVLGPDYAREHPQVLVAVMQSAASDWAAARLSAAIERVALALDEPAAPQHILPAQLLRSRP